MKKNLFLVVLFFLCSITEFGQKNVSDVLSEAANLRTQNRCDEAIIKINEIINTNDKNSWLYLERARCNRQLKNNEAVLDDIRIAFRLNPRDSRLLDIGELELRASGQSVSLIEIADSLIVEDENNAAAYGIRSLNKIVVKDFAGALDDYLKFKELDPLAEFSRAGIVFTSLKGLKEDKDIIAHYIRVMSFYENLLKSLNDRLQIEPKHSLTENRLVFTLMQDGEVLQSLSMDLADLYFANNEAEKAELTLGKMVQIEPKGVAYGYRYEYYKRNKKYEEAIKDFTIYSELVRQAKKQPRLNAKFYVERGDLYVLANKYEKAITDFEMAITQDERIALEVNEKISSAKRQLQK